MRGDFTMNIDGSALEFLHVHPDLLKVFITHVFSSLYQCLELTGSPYSARLGHFVLFILILKLEAYSW